MKKKVLALLLATAMISTFVACGKEETPAADDTNTTVEDTTGGEDTNEPADEEITCTLTVWAPSEDQSDDNPWLKTQCEAFAAEHPNWHITFKYGVCAEGDAKATEVRDAFIFQVSKVIGSMAAVLKGKVDAIVVTGGIAYDKGVVAGLKEACEWIAPFTVYPGEDELGALVQGGLRVLNGEEEAKVY